MDGKKADAVPGACLCGAIRFEVSGTYRWAAHCHCSMCRKHHGSLFSTSLGVSMRRFRWIGGEDLIVHYRSSPAFERAFCSACGSKVPSRSQDPDVMNVPAGTLEDNAVIEPRTHIFVASKAACVTITDSLAQFEAYPPGIGLPDIARPQPSETQGRVNGSCLCDAVAYEIGGELERRIDCACARCRRSRGSLYATDTLVPHARFAWTRGAGLVRSFELRAARAYRTDFCGGCGSLLPTAVSGSGEVSIPVGSVDTSLRQIATMTATPLISRTDPCALLRLRPQNSHCNLP